MTIALNRHVRSAVAAVANSAMIHDETYRLQVMDEALNRVDRVLTELVPSSLENGDSRFSFSDSD